MRQPIILSLVAALLPTLAAAADVISDRIESVGLFKNGLAVVPVERGASGGSFFTIPPQVQVEIASRKKIISDEHSGRILVDPALADEEQQKMEQIFEKVK